MTEPLRILHVITRLIVGGAQMNTVLCAKAQVAAGHEVHIAYGPDRTVAGKPAMGPEGSLEAEAEAAGAKLHLTPSLVRAVSPAADRRCFSALKATVRGLRPDVVHTHSSKAGIVGRFAAHAVRGDDPLPLILHTVHGLPWNDAMFPLKRLLYVALERWAAKRCDHLIAITPAMVDAFVEAGVAERERFSVVPSGVELEPFLQGPTPEEARQQLGLTEPGPWVGLVARLDRLKGHADLFAAWPAIRAAVPGARLLLVGDGPDAAEIRAAGAGLEGLRWLGRTATERCPRRTGLWTPACCPATRKARAACWSKRSRRVARRSRTGSAGCPTCSTTAVLEPWWNPATPTRSPGRSPPCSATPRPSGIVSNTAAASCRSGTPSPR